MPPPRRVARPDPDQLQPLYPTARLLKAAVLEADQLRREAALLRDEAATLRAQAAATRQQAEQDAKSLRATAMAQGQRDGATRLAQLLRNATRHADQRSQAFQQEVSATSLRIARTVLHAELSHHPQLIADLVTEELDRLRQHFPQRVAVHLHPDDYALLQGQENDLADLFAGDTPIQLVPDPAVPPHGIRIVTESDHIDTSIDEQLDRLAKKHQNA